MGGVEFWKALANDFHTPQTALSLLHKKGDRDLERAIVGHHNVSVGVLAEIAQHGDSEVLAKFGGYRYSSTGEDPARHPEVTRRLAANPATPIDLLAGLARSEDDDTCRLALSNPRFPTATLVEYAASDDARMIQLAASTGNQSALDSIAANPNASRDLLVALAQGGNQAVRDALLLNKSTPPDILLMLIEADSSQ